MNAQTDELVKWQKFTGFDEEFSVEIPENIRMTKFPENRKESPRFYEGVAENTYFFISSGEDFPTVHYKLLAEIAAENGAQAVETKIGNLPARKFSFTDDEDFRQTILAVQGSRRFYIFHTLSETPHDTAVAERFFSTLSFGDLMPLRKFPKTEVLKLKTKDIGDDLSPNSEAFSVKNDIGAGIREKPPSGNSPLTFTYQPKPAYTDQARLFGIKGTVILRVAFLADGTIGDVTPVKRLPFGLTKSAVKSARGMRFEPEWKNGQPVSVVKTISFGFSFFDYLKML
ncbi:MAG TPA: energy transducer TonB [Pyrinomonadaceae bacterium]|nr:energy transducer TonB [Pyrinomonadaceae bacterium]